MPTLELCPPAPAAADDPIVHSTPDDRDFGTARARSAACRPSDFIVDWQIEAAVAGPINGRPA